MLPATAQPPRQGPGGPPPGQPGLGGPGAADKPEEPPTDAELAIDAAATKLAKLEWVAAELVQDVNMLNQKYAIKGSYRKGPDSRVYLRLTVSGLTDSTATTLQVCDGETLWDYQVILDAPVYRKLSVKPILERLNSPELNPKLREQAITQMGLAGPETLLIGLRRTLHFTIKEEDEIDGKKVWKLRGACPVNPGGFLPPYYPMDCTLYLGKEDGWPYKLVMVGRKPSAVFDGRRLGPDGRPIGSKSSIEKITPSEIRLVYTDVKLNAKLRLEEFAFTAPPSANVDDSTESLVKGLDQAIAVEGQRKKSEAAKKEGPLLDQPIELPSPPDPSAPRP
jgi:outer membrane lipoprotein-sorting protein